MKPATGGEATRIIEGIYPVVWSADSEWLVCKPKVGGGWKDILRFVRIADGREVEVSTPGYLILQSPRDRKLFFYHGSYDYHNMLKVVSVAGGPIAELGWPRMSFGLMPGYQLWTHDARSILVEGERKGGDWGFWAVPRDGKNPQPINIDTPLCQQAYLRLFSPDGSRLLLIMGGVQGTWDIWVVPVSLAQMRSTGPPVKIFEGMVPSMRAWPYFLYTWSPDGKRIAFSHKGDIWVTSAEGENPIQLTKTSERDRGPAWSPDGTMIAFDAQSPPHTNTLIRVIPASGGEAKVVTEIHRPEFSYAWSPDGKELTIASEPEGAISNFPISGGEARTVLRVKDIGIDGVDCLRWSPDRRLLGFQGTEGGKQKFYVYDPENAKVERFDLGGFYNEPWYWSPDSKWISYFSLEAVKTRPEGILWEMDVEEALAKLAK